MEYGMTTLRQTVWHWGLHWGPYSLGFTVRINE